MTHNPCEDSIYISSRLIDPFSVLQDDFPSIHQMRFRLLPIIIEDMPRPQTTKDLSINHNEDGFLDLRSQMINPPKIPLDLQISNLFFSVFQSFQECFRKSLFQTLDSIVSSRSDCPILHYECF